MKKFLAALLATLAASALLLPHSASAQGAAPVEGKQYKLLAKPQPTPPGKIEVIEFFWYGCVHCNAFAPTMKAWAARQKADVVVKRVPVAFGPEYMPHNKIYYTLDVMKKLDVMHEKVFHAIFVDRKEMLDPNEIADVMAKNGLDRKQFLDTFNSFPVVTSAQRAPGLVDAYGIQGTPSVVIQGKYLTSPSIAGGAAQATQTMDWLIDQIRKGKK
ncbi:thiol:disulfide interchange protein DsbA/DsbL [Imbroritus primus]|uniref:Thiol:disulfide interchange protein DsbA/DsbL n=1 Tax=Imbroritus primus TaxID=3058603 RepID=A0ACD3SLP6_9BURK|nr:thiol:disulfide interchange protein DsbA/DsbL [Burkholderiaceae bacterium PBA]